MADAEREGCEREVVGVRDALAACSLLLLTNSAVAQVAPVGLGEPLDSYVSYSVTRHFGVLGYCGLTGQEKFFKNADKRLARIRAALTRRLGEPAVARADELGNILFNESLGSVDFGGCKIDDPEQFRRSYIALKKAREPALRELEATLGLPRK